MLLGSPLWGESQEESILSSNCIKYHVTGLSSLRRKFHAMPLYLCGAVVIVGPYSVVEATLPLTSGA
jgi:hypothetical protein